MLGTMLLLSSCGGKPLAIGRNLVPTATPGLPSGQPAPITGGGGPIGDPSTVAADGTSVLGQYLTNPSSATSVSATDSIPSPISPNPTSAPVPPAITPTVNPELGKVAIPVAPAPNYVQRWRDQQVERVVLPAPRNYVSPGYQIVYWFDPVFGSYLPIGELHGEFTVQATFRIKGEWITSLELPFNITTKEYGITVPDAIVQRMKNAGVTEWAEVFIRKTSDIQPK